jgi:DNA-binding NtrC family response regulator
MKLVDLPKPGFCIKEEIRAVERHFVSQALTLSSGNVSHAAELLGVNRTTLVEMRRRLGFTLGERSGWKK